MLSHLDVRRLPRNQIARQHAGQSVTSNIAAIFDESSILDTPSIYRVLAQLPIEVNLIFIGDPGQLPPIGPGLPFHTMVKASSIPSVTRAHYEGGIPTEALLAQIAVSKYADGLPLYWQEAIYARDNVELDRKLMAQWMGKLGVELDILADYIPAEIKKSELIFADETTLSTLADIYRSLKPGGVYYAVTGCHTDNPLWPKWRTLVAEKTNTVVQDRSITDYAGAFKAAGFKVSARKLELAGFLAYSDNGWTPDFADALDYYTQTKIVYQLLKS